MVILIAALIGITVGFKGNLGVVEGQSDDTIVNANNATENCRFQSVWTTLT